MDKRYTFIDPDASPEEVNAQVDEVMEGPAPTEPDSSVAETNAEATSTPADDASRDI